jgi:hypothetical protein
MRCPRRLKPLAFQPEREWAKAMDAKVHEKACTAGCGARGG